MPKIAFLGAGSSVFAKNILGDAMMTPALSDSHIALYDIFNKLAKERIATPLRPGVGIKRPMEPMEKREFTVWIEPIEQLWNPKRVEVEKTGLKYQ